MTQEQTGKPLKEAKIIEEASLDEPIHSLKPALTIDNFSKIEYSENSPEQPELKKKTKPKKRKALVLFLIVLCAVVLAEIIIFVYQLIKSPNVLSFAWLILLISALGYGIRFMVKEWLALRTLKRRAQSKQSIEHLLDSPAIGNGLSVCQNMATSISIAKSEDWERAIQSNFSDKEVLAVFENNVMAQADKQALRILSKNASAAGAMIAVSPFAVLDMLLVLWRNIVMLEQISCVYGVQLSYWSRIHLIKSIFKVAIYAGASEILSDASSYVIGAGTAGKLSTRVAQGLGASVLTGRIGINAMLEVRPMPFYNQPKPKLSDISKQVLADLKNLV